MSSDSEKGINDLETEFHHYVDLGTKLPTQAADDMLIAYSLYKQAILGDNNNPRPTENSNIVATFKHDAWERLRGMSKERAMKEYIKHIKKLINH